MLVQIHTSEAEGSDADVCTPRSVTGQGIHTDGKEPLCTPRILQEGDVSFFKDNELFHYVSPAGPEDPSEDMARTMLLIHYPAEEVLVGGISPKNDLGTRAAGVKLRLGK